MAGIDRVWRGIDSSGKPAIYAAAGGAWLLVGPEGAPSAERLLEAFKAGVPLILADARAAQRAAKFEARMPGPKGWSPPFPASGRGVKAAERYAARLAEVHARIKADFGAVKGRVILVRELTGYVDDNSVDFFLKTPAKVRVVDTPEGDLFHQVDREWVDPYWDLELVEPHPELEGARSFWMFGPSYNVVTGESAPARYETAP